METLEVIVAVVIGVIAVGIVVMLWQSHKAGNPYKQDDLRRKTEAQGKKKK